MIDSKSQKVIDELAKAIDWHKGAIAANEIAIALIQKHAGASEAHVPVIEHVPLDGVEYIVNSANIAASAIAESAPAKRRTKMSPTARKKIAEAQKRRWSEYHKKNGHKGK